MDTRMLSLIGLALFSVSACGSTPTVSHTEPHGIVVMAPARTASDYFEVQLREVDGEQVLGQQHAYWLAPGRHTLRFTAIFTDAGRALIPEVRETRQEHEANVLVLEVQEGKRYLIAAHRFGARSGDWEPVVLEVQDIH